MAETNFRINVEVNPSQAKSGASDVAGALRSVGDQADRARSKVAGAFEVRVDRALLEIDRLESQFASLEGALNPAIAAERELAETQRFLGRVVAEGIATQARATQILEQYRAETLSVRDAVDDMASALGGVASDNARRLGDSLSAAGGAFGGLAEALQREAQVLERIKGPAREYQADLQAIISLERQGKLTSDEAAAALQKLNQQRQSAARATPAVAASAPSSPDNLSKGPFGALPEFLKLGGQAQQKAAGLSAAVGLAASKFGVMGTAVGTAVGALQAFALGGPVGAAIFAVTELIGTLGSLASKLGDVAKDFAETDFGGSIVDLQTGGVYSDLKKQLDEAVKAAKQQVEILKLQDKETRKLIASTESYADAAKALSATVTGAYGADTISKIVEQERAVSNLRVEVERLDRVRAEAGSSGPRTAEDKKKYEELTAAIAEATEATARYGDKYQVAVRSATSALDDQEDALKKIELLELKLASLRSDTSGRDSTLAIAAAEREIADAKQAQEGPVDRLANDAIRASRAAEDLREHLQSAIQLAQNQGEFDAVKRLQKDLEDASKTAASAAGRSSGGLSERAQFLKSLTEPIAKLQREERFLADAWAKGALTLAQYEDATRTLADQRERLTGVRPDTTFDQDRFADEFNRTGPGVDELIQQAQAAESERLDGLRAVVEKQRELLSTLENPLDTYRRAINDINDPQLLLSEQQRVELLAKARDAFLAAAPAARQFGDAIAEDRSAEQLANLQPILESIKTPAEKFADEMARINDAFRGTGLVDEYNRAVAQTTKAFEDADPATQAYRAALDQLDDQISSSLVSALNDLGDAIGAVANGAEFDFERMSKAILRSIAEIAAKRALLAAFGPEAVAFGSPAANLLGGLLGFATGGQFTVGSHGGKTGTDSQLVAFRATPGEQVIVRTPEQRQSVASSSSSAQLPPQVIVRNINVTDPSQSIDALASNQGESTVMNTIRTNRAAIRALLQ